jgi:membrane protease YdiL (CAAX protease family)
LGLGLSPGRLKQGLLGFLVGAAANSLPWLVAWASGAARLEAHLLDGEHPLGPALWLGILAGTLNATFEEATSRAAPLALLRPWPAWRSAALSALLFALMHALGEALSPARLFYLFSLGVLLAWAYVATGHIWLGVGLHAGWFWASLLPSGRFHAGAALELRGAVGVYVLISDALLGLLALLALFRLSRQSAPACRS